MRYPLAKATHSLHFIAFAKGTPIFLWVLWWELKHTLECFNRQNDRSNLVATYHPKHETKLAAQSFKRDIQTFLMFFFRAVLGNMMGATRSSRDEDHDAGRSGRTSRRRVSRFDRADAGDTVA